MSRKQLEDYRVKRCGCIEYDFGPPHICPKHQLAEEKGLRRAVREQAEARGHRLTQFSEYESRPGKWTAFCMNCERLVIVYDAPPDVGDQINGPQILEKDC
jgi:hypothetical protein